MVMIQGPELAGGNIELDMIFNKTDVEKRQTKIFCTLGPACWTVPQLETLINAGLNCARFNFSHGDHAGHKACLDRLREAMVNTGKQVGTFKKIEINRIE
jgi:pyruvate kinase